MRKNSHVGVVMRLVLVGGLAIAGIQSAMVVAVPAPVPVVMTNPSWSNNQFSVLITGAPQSTCVLEYKTSAGATSWASASTGVVQAAGTVVLTDLTATNACRFYRVRVQSP